MSYEACIGRKTKKSWKMKPKAKAGNSFKPGKVKQTGTPKK